MDDTQLPSVLVDDEPFSVWKCGACGTQHDDAESAKQCCAPEIKALYLCNTCHTSYSGKDDAVQCCAGQPLRWSAEALEQNGQIRLPLNENKEAA